MLITKKKLSLFGGASAFALITYLVAFNLITINSYSGDMICDGTIEDPCIAQINFTANKPVMIKPLSSSYFNTDIPIKEIKVFNGTDFLDFSKKISLKRRQNYSWTFYGYKINPLDNIKWSFGEVDPVWLARERGIVISPQRNRNYRIISITGNESILFDSKIVINPNRLIITPAFTNNKTIEECIDYNITIGKCINSRNVTYFQSNTIPIETPESKGNLIKQGGIFSYIFPDLPQWFEWIKIGLGTITIVGDTSYASNDTNITQESGFAHLNLSNSNTSLYMPFDINSTIVYDYSNNSNDGTLKNGIIWNNTGIIGGGYSFDGSNDFIQILNNQKLNNIQIVTVSAWARSYGSGITQIIFSTYDGTNAYQLYISNGNHGSLWSNGGGALGSGTNVADGLWHHLVAIWDGTNARIYIDNVLKATGARTIGNTALDNQIGTQCSGAGSTTCSAFFNGDIDEVMVINQNLSDSQISDIYNNQSARFLSRGEQLFQNLNFGVNNTVNVSIKNCNTLLSSNLSVKFNSGAEKLLSNCNATGITLSGDLTNQNMTLIYGAGSNNFYTPEVIGNITLDDYLVSAGDTCAYSSGNWNIQCKDNCSITSAVDVGANSITINGSGQFTTTKNISVGGNISIIGQNTVNQCKVYCLGGCFV